MSREESLLEVLEKALPLPPRIIVGYNNLERDFTSGDLARICNISRIRRIPLANSLFLVVQVFLER